MKNKQIIILGAGGFLSGAIEKELNKFFQVINLNKKKVDLKNIVSLMNLSKRLIGDDIIIFAASEAPVKNNSMFLENIKMSINFIKLFSNYKFKLFLYISSDAVYEDKKILNENSKALPNSLHGLMHLTRENLFKNFLNCPITIVRPTLVYGPNDPHNSYGPNSFFRLTKKGKDIFLFGRGEEQRDHIFIDDLAKIIKILIKKNKKGIYNIASGKVLSFYNIAKKIVSLNNNITKIKYIERNGPMHHLGYRSFCIKKIKKLNFVPSSFDEIYKKIYKYY